MPPAAALGIAAVLVILALLFAGLWLRGRLRLRSERRDRIAAQREMLELRLALDEQTARLRIIRELHEVAVHHVSVIVSQADGARFAGERDPGAAFRSVTTIGESARSTLADLRRVMTVVREGEAEVSPQPRLGSTRDLFKVMRDAGLIIEFDEVGEPFELRQGAEVVVYRILQEALSNALKHGGDGTEVRVAFTWTADGLQVKVDDDGVRARDRRAGLDPNSESQRRGYSIDDDMDALTEVVSGTGITAMRERAALFGGVFHAHSVPGVGFSVAVVFPALRYHNGIHGVNLGR
nr:ATP-binding protein [Galbitalea soli]